MPRILVSKSAFLADRQGSKFADVVRDSELPFEVVLEFFNSAERQRRMEESEIHHDRAPLAGVVRELESNPEMDKFLSELHTRRSRRLRQAIGVLVRIIMERRGKKITQSYSLVKSAGRVVVVRATEPGGKTQNVKFVFSGKNKVSAKGPSVQMFLIRK